MIAIGMVVLAYAGTKTRVCVLLRIREADGALVLVAGTGTAREGAISVLHGSRAWAAMRLEKSTYFYASSLCVVMPEKVLPTPGMCPPNVLAELRQLVGIR